MISRIISVIMTAVISLTGTTLSGFESVTDTVCEMLYGIPVTSQAINDDFFADIDAFDFTVINEDTAFVNNKIASKTLCC